MLFINKRRKIYSIIVMFFLVSVYLFCSNDKLTNDDPIPVHKAGVRVTVTDSATGAPIQNATVAIYNSITDVEAASGITDNLGTSVLVVNADTSYYLKAAAAGYLSFDGTFNPFQVTENDTVDRTVQLVKIASPAVVKVVVSQSGSTIPVKNAEIVICKTSTNDTLLDGTSDTLGVCFFIVPGDTTYYLRVSTPGYLPYPLPGVTPVHFIAKQADTTSRAVKLTKITSPAVVKVVITDDTTSAPVQGAAVVIHNAYTNQAVGSGATDNLGTCFLEVIGDTSYYLKVTAGGYYSHPLPGAATVPFLAAANDTTDRAIALKRKTSSAMVVVYVNEDSTGIPIKDADVVLYNSSTSQAQTRALTDNAGGCILFVQANIGCYLRVAAQNYRSSPPPNGSAVPFPVGDSGSITYRYVKLKKNPVAINCGTISGAVKSATGAAVRGSLVIATRQSDSITISGISGPDGVYILYNVPAGIYDMQGFLEGWYQTSPVCSVGVTSGNVTQHVDIPMTAVRGAALSGMITFLASVNSKVDVTLAHPVSYEAIPGLFTMMLANRNYAIDSIPPGTYIPWASYRNDGYVMDPDWIRKFGLPVMTFLQNDSAKTLDFSITDAILIISPTNHGDTLIPVNISTTTPEFVWTSYPSTQEYIVGVYNEFGDLIWGGYDENNKILHPKLDAKTTRVVFNFDSSAKEPIRGGYAYRWKVWADKGSDPDVQQLISASEDLMGLFAIYDRKRRPIK